jgi:hypothetical protein
MFSPYDMWQSLMMTTTHETPKTSRVGYNDVEASTNTDQLACPHVEPTAELLGAVSTTKSDDVNIEGVLRWAVETNARGAIEALYPNMSAQEIDDLMFNPLKEEQLMLTEQATFIRPLAVMLAQLRACWFVLRYGCRVLEFTDGYYLGPLAVKLHYLQIETDDGRILYQTDKAPASVRDAKVREMRNILEQASQKFERL